MYWLKGYMFIKICSTFFSYPLYIIIYNIKGISTIFIKLSVLILNITWTIKTYPN